MMTSQYKIKWVSGEVFSIYAFSKAEAKRIGIEERIKAGLDTRIKEIKKID